MSVNEALANSLMTSFFLMYLTDYSGIGALAASLGTGLLVFARIFDVVNDPIEGWIMDRAKPSKYGKYKPFIFLSIALISVGVAALFFIPSGITGNSFMVCVWVIVGYLLYDIGSSFFAPRLVYRGMTLDPDQRGKLLIRNRAAGHPACPHQRRSPRPAHPNGGLEQLPGRRFHPRGVLPRGLCRRGKL